MTNKNRVVIITGATSGIGLATVEKLKSAGYQVALTGRNPDKVKACAEKLGVSGYVLDVAREEDCAEIVQRIEQEVGPVWGLINNAGIWLEIVSVYFCKFGKVNFLSGIVA